MSRLLFDSASHKISLIGDNGSVVGTWSAYNNVDSHATIRHVQNGTYDIQDKSASHRHHPDANGPYGSHGIIRFNVPGHPGIGIHSGRANARHLPGPQHPTMGCIRTSDEAMRQITQYIRNSPLLTIQVTNNSASIAVGATHRNDNSVVHDKGIYFI